MAQLKSFPPDHYHVGWICPLDFELAAAKAILDEEHQNVQNQDPEDHNTYTLGELWGHKIVIAGLPAGYDGITPAATVAKDMTRTFKFLRFGLIIGTGGGIPYPENDIRLGDVVVSHPSEMNGGVIQYDMGKNSQDVEFVQQGVLRPPPQVLLTAITALKANHMLRDSSIGDFHAQMIKRYPKLKRGGFGRPDVPDRLFKATYVHQSGTCQGCQESEEIIRPSQDPIPQVYYGIIASGNQTIENAIVRDTMKDFGALCIDREAAGLLDFPCLVIRGIANYADSHTNTTWERYAASTAACFAKELLTVISVQQVQSEKPMQVADSMTHDLLTQIRDENQQYYQQQEKHQISEEEAKCLLCFKTSSYVSYKNLNRQRVPNTCRWVLEHPKYLKWLESSKDDLLWISAGPGCGKSVLSRALVDEALPKDLLVSYFFFKDNEKQKDLTTALCALIHQLLEEQSQLIRHAIPIWEKNGDKLQEEAEELWRLLITASTDDEKSLPSIVFVLDALDECQESDRRLIISMLRKFYMASFSSSQRAHTVKFLVTSRHYHDIEIEFRQMEDKSSPIINLSGQEESDKISQEINHVIRVKVEDMAYRLELNDAIRTQIEVKLQSIEHRTYLWLHLVMDDIEETYRNSLLPHSEVINMIPSTVNDAYEKILNKVPKKQRQKVMEVFQIVIGARRALTTNEIAIALAISSASHPSFQSLQVDKGWIEKKLCSICGLFIYIKDSKIFLIHQTAKEFLIRKKDELKSAMGSWKHSLSMISSEILLASICIEYFSLPDFQQSYEKTRMNKKGQSTSWSIYKAWNRRQQVLEDNQEQPLGFLAYAAENWLLHLNAVSRGSQSSYNSLTQQTIDLLQRGRKIIIWAPMFWSLGFLPNEKPLLQQNWYHVTTTPNLRRVTNLLSKNLLTIDKKDSQGEEALRKIADQLNENIIDEWMKKKEDPDPCLISRTTSDRRKRFRLQISKDPELRKGLKAAVAASTCAHCMVSPLKTELTRGATVEEALETAHQDIVELILEKGADEKTPYILRDAQSNKRFPFLLPTDGQRETHTVTSEISSFVVWQDGQQKVSQVQVFQK